MNPMNQMNNPLMALVSAMQSGANPMTLMQQMASSNPQIQQAMQMMQGKTPAQLEQLARNMARERGTTIEDVARSLGIGFPSNR